MASRCECSALTSGGERPQSSDMKSVSLKCFEHILVCSEGTKSLLHTSSHLFLNFFDCGVDSSGICNHWYGFKGTFLLPVRQSTTKQYGMINLISWTLTFRVFIFLRWKTDHLREGEPAKDGPKSFTLHKIKIRELVFARKEIYRSNWP